MNPLSSRMAKLEVASPGRQVFLGCDWNKEPPPVIAAHVAQHADHAAAEFMVFGWMLDSDVLEEREAAQ